MSGLTDVPWPDTYHPRYAEQATAVQARLNQQPIPGAVVVFDDESTAPDPARQLLALTVRRYHALAPYVGDPAVYMWPVALDFADGWIAGAAYLVTTGDPT